MAIVVKSLIRYLAEKAGVGHLSSVGMHHIDMQLQSILQLRNGFFIEVGANDGITQSNTYILEKAYGCRGLLIEPIPRLAKECKARRKRSIVVNAALVASGYQSDTVLIEDADQMSVVRDGTLDEGWIDGHVTRGRELQGMKETTKLRVPARTLDSVLSEHQIQSVDFFSLDVEGYEYEVLKGLSLDKVKVTNIFIETRETNESAIDEHLTRYGYRCDYSWRTPEYTNKLYSLS